MIEELRRVLGFYGNAHVAEKEICDKTWFIMYDELFMPVYETVLEAIEVELKKLPTNNRFTSKEIMERINHKKVIIEALRKARHIK